MKAGAQQRFGCRAVPVSLILLVLSCINALAPVSSFASSVRHPSPHGGSFATRLASSSFSSIMTGHTEVHHEAARGVQTQRRRENLRCLFGFGAMKKGPPADYDAITSQAIAAVQAGLKAGEKAMEVEFPPLASLNKMNDGSAKNRGLAQAKTLAFVKKLIGALNRGKKVYVVCCEPGARKALDGGIGSADVRDLDSRNLPPAKSGDIQVVITPADQGQWKLAKKMSETATVVIVNGVFVNGYMPFEPVYYFKPISGWGSLMRQYPGTFTAYLAGSNKVVPCEAGLVRQGDIRRPDLRTAANALSAAYGEQEAKR